MKTCQQSKNQTIYKHGVSVKNYLFDLLNHLRGDQELKYEWKLPQWVYDEKDFILSNILDDEILELYTLYHDVGKPYCMTIDDDGGKHFPNHAEVSYKVFKSVFMDTDNVEDISQLIKRDMDFHLLKAKDLEEFSKTKYSITLILSALSEIHSNAKMFGGLDSVSFKIKWKHTNKKGRQVINLIKNNNNKNKNNNKNYDGYENIRKIFKKM